MVSFLRWYVSERGTADPHPFQDLVFGYVQELPMGLLLTTTDLDLYILMCLVRLTDEQRTVVRKFVGTNVFHLTLYTITFYHKQMNMNELSMRGFVALCVSTSETN